MRSRLVLGLTSRDRSYIGRTPLRRTKVCILSDNGQRRGEYERRSNLITVIVLQYIGYHLYDIPLDLDMAPGSKYGYAVRPIV